MAKINQSDKTTRTTNTRKRSFVITGFGPFGGVEENPTTVIVSKIDLYLRSSLKGDSETHASTVADRIKECVIVETSAQAVNETLERIQTQYCCSCDDDENSKILLLHLGVGRSQGFRLESCAYNEATFRISDQKGYQPFQQAIVESDPVENSYPTSLDLKALQSKMTRDFPTISTAISTDPGRFVCNYVYCRSLEVSNHANKTKKNKSCESLFLHVPHFDIVSEEHQLAYVAGLIKNLAEYT
eukprot:CAMPEP_0116134416 /NCGR_PEP_ID=MMETSP0329-20121206/10632_1 /TAXON_ID=697910 /ORGANISM="Pseudo-nitzschia arenysensis, Strain B593" /LENGTH=242 /DNA_ID=CAMNT_0003629121 /DNA_START=22 /DNA_END=753 /DNA_ORIENTATION=-